MEGEGGEWRGMGGVMGAIMNILDELSIIFWYRGSTKYQTFNMILSLVVGICFPR